MLLAGFLAWGVPQMLKVDARDDAQDTVAAPGAEPELQGPDELPAAE